MFVGAQTGLGPIQLPRQFFHFLQHVQQFEITALQDDFDFVTIHLRTARSIGCGSCGSVGPVKESFVGKTLDKLGKLLHFGGRETAPAMAPAVVFGGEMAAANASLQSAQAAFAKSQQGLLGRIFSKQK